MQNKKIPEGWKEVKLGEVVEIIDGDRGKNYPNGNDLLNNGFCVFLNTKNVSGGYFNFNEITFISEEKDKQLRKGKLNRGDFVLTTRGTVGNYAYYGDNVKYDNIRINSGMVILRVKSIEKKFFNYYLGSTFFKKQILSLQSGSAQPQLPIRDLKNFKIYFPENLEEQKAIASILSSFDDKIELLQEENETLEEIGKTIFKEWFGKYKVGDELPEGWRVGKLGEIGKIVCGKTPSKKDKTNFGGNIPFIKIPDMQNQMFILKTEDSLTEKGANTQKNKFIPKNSICVSCIATVGLVSITTKDSQTNQQINSIIPKYEFFLEYLYFLLKSKRRFLNDIGSGGTATLNINTTTFSNIKIIIPDNQTLQKFNQAVKPLFEKIKQNSDQIQTLKNLRDTLLPKLMSGEVRVVNNE